MVHIRKLSEMLQIMKLEQTCADLRNDLDSMTNRYEKLVLNINNNFFVQLFGLRPKLSLSNV